MKHTDKPTTTASAQPDNVRDKRHGNDCGYQRINATKGECDCGYFNLPDAEERTAMKYEKLIDHTGIADPIKRTIPAEKPTAPTHVELVHVRQELGAEIKRLQLRLSTAGQRNGELHGTIATLQGELDHYKAQAAQLAEALKLTLSHVEELGMDGNELTDAANAMREALAAYEEGK